MRREGFKGKVAGFLWFKEAHACPFLSLHRRQGRIWRGGLAAAGSWLPLLFLLPNGRLDVAANGAYRLTRERLRLTASCLVQAA